jgi:CDGSH-type Zn-finger protein
MSKTKITIKSDSALRIEGEFEILDQDGNKYDIGDRNVISLCRCGLSKKMPFCDGAHKGVFQHEAKAFDFDASPKS